MIVFLSVLCMYVMLTHFLGRPRGLFSFSGSFEKEIGKGIKHIETLVYAHNLVK